MSAAVITTPIQSTDHSTTEMDESGTPRLAHIVRCPPDHKSVNAYLMAAMIEGFEVEALCGKVWIPSRDPKKYPVCEPCIDEASNIATGGKQ